MKSFNNETIMKLIVMFSKFFQMIICANQTLKKSRVIKCVHLMYQTNLKSFPFMDPIDMKLGLEGNFAMH
jgi:hypothetical protein